VPREIFGEMVNPGRALGSRSSYSVTLSIVAHVAVGAVIVIAPLVAAGVVPAPRTVIGAFTARAALPEPPAPPVARAGVSKAAPSSAQARVAPADAPSAITPEPATTGAELGDRDGVVGGLPNGTTVGSVGIVPTPPIPPAPAASTRPVPVGGRIKEPEKIRHVAPVYPGIAQQVGVQGIVIVEAIIGTDGRVREARVLGSKPLLDEAALAAVRQWVFTPTLLNGVPVPVIMTVTVNFRLN